MAKKSPGRKWQWTALVVGGWLILSQLQVVTTYSPRGVVQGKLIARGDDADSGSGSGGGDSPAPAAPEQRTEIRFGGGERIKTRVEEDRTRVDVYSGGVKVRYEIREGQTVVKAETEAGEGVPETEVIKVKERLEKSGVQVATEGGQLLVARNGIGAVSHFPLQVNAATGELIASTSAGQRVLTVLPDAAVQNMLAANAISRLGAAAVNKAVKSGQVTSVAQVVTLGERHGVPVYQIDGLRDRKLLGFIPVSTPVTLFVSPETGDLVSQQQPLLSTLVDFLSP